MTLNVLEEYLKEFKGTLIIVSHDRHFLDRLVDHLFIFQEDGTIKDFVGSYSQYRSLNLSKGQSKSQSKVGSTSSPTVAGSVGSAGDGTRGDAPESDSSKPRKLTYKEQRELEQLEKDIQSLTAEKADLESKLNGGLTDHEELQRVSARFSEVSDLLDAAETRWLELSI